MPYGNIRGSNPSKHSGLGSALSPNPAHCVSDVLSRTLEGLGRILSAPNRVREAPTCAAFPPSGRRQAIGRVWRATIRVPDTTSRDSHVTRRVTLATNRDSRATGRVLFATNRVLSATNRDSRPTGRVGSALDRDSHPAGRVGSALNRDSHPAGRVGSALNRDSHPTGRVGSALNRGSHFTRASCPLQIARIGKELSNRRCPEPSRSRSRLGRTALRPRV
jgi:hypothetical protein